MNVQKFYQRLAQVRAELDIQFPAEVSEIFLTSLETDDGGRQGEVVGASRELAAQSLARKTHRVSTPEEIDGFFRAQRQRANQYAAEELRSDKKSVVVLSPDNMAALTGAAVTQLAAQSSAAGEQGRARTTKG